MTDALEAPPDGQITSLNQNRVKPDREKYSSSVFRKFMISLPRPASTRGAYRDRHGRWKRDAVDERMFQRACAPTKASSRTAKPCGPDSPTLGSSSHETFRRERRGPTSPEPRGEHGAAVKTIVQGMPVVPALPVVTAACFFCCRRAMGAASIRHSLRPLNFGGTRSRYGSGGIAPRECESCLRLSEN